MKINILKIKALTLIAMIIFLPVNLSSAWHSYSDMEDTEKIGESYPDSWQTPYVSPGDTAMEEKAKNSVYEEAPRKSAETIIKNIVHSIMITVYDIIQPVVDWINNVIFNIQMNRLSRDYESDGFNERMKIIADEDTGEEERANSINELSVLIASRELFRDRSETHAFNISIKDRQKAAHLILDNISLLSDPDEKENVLKNLWVFVACDPRVDDETRDRIVLKIEENYINSRNEKIWNEFSVLILDTRRDLDENSQKLFYSVLSSLPEEMHPPLISYKNERPNVAGSYSIFNREVKIMSGNPRVLYHEIGHYTHFCFMDISECARWRHLWNESGEDEDYAYAYGSTDIREDVATMYEFYTYNTEGFLIQTIQNTKNSGRDIRLRKFEEIAGFFSHTRETGDGEILEATYVYEIDGNSDSLPSITRRSVAISPVDIEGETYMLPDFNEVYEERVF